VPNPADPPDLDVTRIVRVLDTHQVEYLLVGGVAAAVHGAARETLDIDCLAAGGAENLTRLAAAMRELNARLHVEGLDDAEAIRLPVVLDADTLARMEISTWRTDAGDLDILADIPDRSGRHLRYAELLARANTVIVAGIPVYVASLDDVIASKEWANRPKDHEALPELYDLREQDLGPDEAPPPTPPGDAG
jgi:hypothetical protein